MELNLVDADDTAPSKKRPRAGPALQPRSKRARALNGGGHAGKNEITRAEQPRRLRPAHVTQTPAERVAPVLSVAAVKEVFGGVAAESFAALGLPALLVSRLATLGYSKPTRVQTATVPPLLQRRDVRVRSDTGSGKTLAYLLPAITRLVEQSPRLSRADGTAALVLVPTRELCAQVAAALSAVLLPFHWIVPGVVMGGEKRQKEKARLRRGVSFLVATPGRLLDHLRSSEAFSTAPLRWLVLDEADRLLDLGFEEALTDICRLLEERAHAPRCTVLLSATLSPKLETLSHIALRNALTICVDRFEQDAANTKAQRGDGSAELANVLSIPQQLDQRFVVVPAKLRLVALVAALRGWLLKGVQRLVVFVSTCESVDFHARVLPLFEAAGEMLLPCEFFRLHGNMAQAERVASFRAFTAGRAGVLIATDVAARGLDFPDVGAAIQLDPPSGAEEYVHRIGRTARVGHRGEALLFLLPSEQGYLQILSARGVVPSERTLEALLPALPGDRLQGRTPPPESHPSTFAMLRRVETVMAASAEARRAGKDAYTSFVRAYATHPGAAKGVFHVKRLHLGESHHRFTSAYAERCAQDILQALLVCSE